MRFLLITLLWTAPLLSQDPEASQDVAYAMRADANLFFWDRASQRGQITTTSQSRANLPTVC